MAKPMPEERAVLKGGLLGELCEMHDRSWSVRRTARELGVSRNTVRKYLRSLG